MSETDKKPRKPGHGFQKGQVANPKGRTKGTKNRTTIFKEAVIAGAEDVLLKNIETVCQVAVDKAMEGDTTCIKLVLDRVLPAKKMVDVNHGTGKDHNINIVIQSLENTLQAKEAEVVDAEYTEVVVNEQQSKPS